MSDLAVTLIVLAGLFVALFLGQLLRRVLPHHHLDSESKDVVKLGVGVVATLTALVLGLVIAFAKADYNDQSDGIAKLAAELLLLDQLLEYYGPEAGEARADLRKTVARGIDALWGRSDDVGALPEIARHRRLDTTLVGALQSIEQRTDAQRDLKGRILSLVTEIAKARFLLSVQGSNSIPATLFVLVAFWLAFLFGCFGMMAPRNATVFCVLGISAISASGAFFLILELDGPFDGMIQISRAPIISVLQSLGR